MQSADFFAADKIKEKLLVKWKGSLLYFLLLIVNHFIVGVSPNSDRGPYFGLLSID